MRQNKRDYRIRAVQRALWVLKTFSASQPELSLTEIGKRLEVNVSTCLRLLVTLESEGFVERVPEKGRYRLGTSCLELASIYLNTLTLREQALPSLEGLRSRFGETVHLSILDESEMEVVYIEKLQGSLPIVFMSSHVGGRAPAYCTGVGKALLAHQDPRDVRNFYAQKSLKRYTPNTVVDVEQLLAKLAEVRQRGFAADNEEHEVDVVCVAAPLWNYEGRVVAATSVSGPAERMRRRIAEGGLIDELTKTAQTISRNLGAIAPVGSVVPAEEMTVVSLKDKGEE